MSVSSVGREEQSIPADTLDFAAILARISSGASGRDAHPSFPEDPFVRLAPTGALAIPVPDPIDRRGRRASFTEEWRVLRAVAGADGSVGRILDGHFNGVERVSLLAPEPMRSRELEAIAAGKLLLGVWGADPIPGEGGRPGWCKKRAEQGLWVSRPSAPVRRAWIARSCSPVAPPRDHPSLPTSTSPKA